jgi:hypothetical protein
MATDLLRASSKQWKTVLPNWLPTQLMAPLYELFPLSRVLYEKLIVAQVVKKFRTFMKLITVFTRARHRLAQASGGHFFPNPSDLSATIFTSHMSISILQKIFS